MHGYHEHPWYIEVTMVKCLSKMGEGFTQLGQVLCDKLCIINDKTDLLSNIPR